MKTKPGDNPGIRRRDATGHLDPDYARGLRALSGASREGEAVAFLDRPRGEDELSEGLGEAFVEGATSGEGAGPERHERASDADAGGPFVLTSARQEFAYDADGAPAEGDEVEPFPRTRGA
jgi:hypothetical protein